ncbi:MAG: hydrogenase [Chlamydiae bacterium]|nr:hydrogenase [Chlamydiota bacterium]MBI3276320.1 hydrogenase [Chlamydiota bacterium]
MIFFILGLPLAGGALAFMLPINRSRSILLFCVSLIHLLSVGSFWINRPSSVLSGFLDLDSFGIIVLSIFSLLFFAVSLYLPSYIQNEKGRSNRVFAGYLLLLLFSMTLVSLSQHPGLFWVAVESTTLLTAPLINFHRRALALEATWKYLVICSVGIALALLGTFFLAISAIQLKSLLFNEIVHQASLLSIPWLKLSAIFLAVGYGTKMGLVPMHSWKPDAYGEAPGPVGALLSGGLTNCAFLAFLRLIQICNSADQTEFLRPVLLIFGMASIALAAFSMLGQADFNRLLAYSSIEHMGILILGLGLGGAGFYGSLFHAINHAFSKGLIFLVSGNIYQKYRSKRVDNIQGVLRSSPFTGGFLIAAMFAVTGIPPFGTFFSELMILSAALKAHDYGLAFFYLFFLSIVFIAIANTILKMARGLPPDTWNEHSKNESWGSLLPLLLLGGIVFLLGCYVPSFLDRMLLKSSGILGG